MPAQAGRRLAQQRRAIGQLLGQRPSPVEPVAQLPQIAGRAAPRRDPPDGATDVGERPQRRARSLAKRGIVMEMLHQIEPRLDRTLAIARSLSP